MKDSEMLDSVERIRRAHIDDLKKHPLDAVTDFLRNHSNKPQLKRLWGCHDYKQAAGRATHGDAFRITP